METLLFILTMALRALVIVGIIAGIRRWIRGSKKKKEGFNIK